MNIRAAIEAIVKPLLKPFERVVFPCTVVGAFDAATNTIPVRSNLADGLTFDALLSGDTTGSYSLVCVPAQNSLVFVTRPPLSISSAYISKCTTIAKVLAKIGSSTLEWDANSGNLTLNGGNNGGLVIASNTAQKLNNIESDLNSLKTALSAWVPVPSDGGLALKVALAAYYADILIPTFASELENPQIKH